MRIYTSLAGLIRVRITAADLNRTLDVISQAGLQAFDLYFSDELTAQLTVSRKDYRKLCTLCKKQNCELALISRVGIYWSGKRILRRPVLFAGLCFFLLLTLWLPGRVLFVRVQGNETIPARQILDAAQKSGIGFGSARRDVRSERVKNALLEAMPNLQWVGVNTDGCVAVIQVRERAENRKLSETSAIGHIVASQDGVITECTATRGTLICKPGQAVTSGEILISGYTDCGITIRAEQAEGEIYALTRRELSAAMIPRCRLRTEIRSTGKKISILIGKKRINLWKDSGIWDTTCDRMYKEYYITLPGGFQLPLTITVEHFTCWETVTEYLAQSDMQQILKEFGTSYLQRQMLAGKILNTETTVLADGTQASMTGQYICVEMIGIMHRLQIGEYNGENY